MILVDEQKLVDIAENIPKVFNAGYEKGKAEGGTAKPEQEKTIEINKNGTTEILPDEGKVLSKVNVEVDVPSDGSIFRDFISGTIQEIIIPDGVTEIKPYGLAHSYKLQRVILNENVVKLGAYCFSQCSKLESFIIPDSILQIGDSIFQNCSGLKKVVFSNNIKTVTQNMFGACAALYEVDLAQVEVIEKYAFNACKSLKNLILPQTVTTVKSYAFSATGLESITLPSSITSLGSDLFSQCTTLMDLIVNCEIKDNFKLATCLNLTSQSVDSVTNALADLTGKTAKTVTLHTDVKAKLTEEQISAITSKNWNLA